MDGTIRWIDGTAKGRVQVDSRRRTKYDHPIYMYLGTSMNMGIVSILIPNHLGDEARLGSDVRPSRVSQPFRCSCLRKEPNAGIKEKSGWKLQ